MGFFENLFTSFNTIIDSIALQTQYHQLFQYIIGSWLTIRITYFGYLAMFGKLQKPIEQVFWDILKCLIIMLFVTNYNGYLTMVFDAINSFKDYVSGDNNIYATLDKTIKTGGSLATLLYDKGNMFSGSVTSLIVWASVYFACAGPMFILFTTIVTLKILTLTAPIFIGCLMFGWLKNLFTQWLNLIISNVLIYLFLGLVLQISIAFLDEQIILIRENAAANNPNIWGTAGIAVIICGVTYILSKMSAEIAKAVAQASIDSGLIGQSFNTAGRAAGAATRGATVAVGKPVNKLAAKAASGVYSYGEKMVTQGAMKAKNAFNMAMSRNNK